MAETVKHLVSKARGLIGRFIMAVVAEAEKAKREQRELGLQAGFVLLLSIPIIVTAFSGVFSGFLRVCNYTVQNDQLASVDLSVIKAALLTDVNNFREYTACLWRFNEFADALVKILAIESALITTIASHRGWTVLGVISGAIVTAIVGIQVTFPFSDHTAFYRALESRADGVRTELRYTVADGAQFERVRLSFQNLRAEAAAGLPIRAAALPTPTSTPTQAPSKQPAAPGPPPAEPSPQPAEPSPMPAEPTPQPPEPSPANQ